MLERSGARPMNCVRECLFSEQCPRGAPDAAPHSAPPRRDPVFAARTVCFTCESAQTSVSVRGLNRTRLSCDGPVRRAGWTRGALLAGLRGSRVRTGMGRCERTGQRMRTEGNEGRGGLRPSKTGTYDMALLALSFPLVCFSEGGALQLAARKRCCFPLTGFVPGPGVTQCGKAAARLPIASARPALLLEPRGEGKRAHLGLSVVSRRTDDLVPVRDAPRPEAPELATGEVKELSSDLMIPGVAMIVTIPLQDAAGLVSTADIDSGGCWIAVNGIPLKAIKFQFQSNFWGTKKSLDFHVRIPPEHLDEAGLGLLYPGDALSLARMEEADARAFKAKFAEAKKREQLLQAKQREQLLLEQGAEETREQPPQPLESEMALKAELDSKYPTLSSARDVEVE